MNKEKALSIISSVLDYYLEGIDDYETEKEVQEAEEYIKSNLK